MKRILFLVGVMVFSWQGFAQNELKNQYKPIPKKEAKVKEVIPPKEITPKKEEPTVAKAPDSLKVNPEVLFRNTNLYKKEANTGDIFYRRNQYLGQFKTTALFSTVRYRDAAFVDGDKIKVYLNDQVIEPEVNLDGTFKGFKINLVTGVNKIDFEALNEGFAEPNTAEFQVFDDNGVVIKSSQWNVGTGYKATIILVKE